MHEYYFYATRCLAYVWLLAAETVLQMSSNYVVHLVATQGCELNARVHKSDHR